MEMTIDEKPLMADLGIDQANIELRLSLVGFQPEDIPTICLLKPMMSREVDALVDLFFGYLARRPEAEVLLADKPLIDMARALKREHLLAMVEGAYDQRYVGQRLRLAQVYSSTQLPQRVFMGAIEHLVDGIGERIMRLEEDKLKAFQNFRTFRKVASFDIALIVDTLIHEREKVMRSQEESIRQLSTPVLQLREHMLLLPLVGSIGRTRASQLTKDLLTAIRRARARVAVIDLTGTAFLDSAVANHLRGTIQGARMMGCHVILSGISAEVAKALVNQHITLEGIQIVGDLRGGIEVAEHLIQPSLASSKSLTDTEIQNPSH